MPSGGYSSLTIRQWLNPKSIVGLGLGLGLAVWWYWPCEHNCAVSRYLGYRPAVLTELERVPELQQNKLLSEAARLNPKSLWVYRTQLEHARAPEEKMRLLQQIIEVFPLANPIYYLQLAELATDLNRPSDAIRVLELGLSRFPPISRVISLVIFLARSHHFTKPGAPAHQGCSSV